jgi:DNA-binding MltR family transcriptional regulator
MAHALGLISDEQKSDFNYLRKIRNEFAHNWEGVSFETKKVADLASNIRPVHFKEIIDQPLRFQLHAKLTVTLVVLEVRAHAIKRLEDKSVEPTIPYGARD